MDGLTWDVLIWRCAGYHLLRLHTVDYGRPLWTYRVTYNAVEDPTTRCSVSGRGGLTSSIIYY